jgi:ATP-dependent helicase/DNAse subunit B
MKVESLFIYPTRLAIEHSIARALSSAACLPTLAWQTFDTLFKHLGAVPHRQQASSWTVYLLVRNAMLSLGISTDPWNVAAFQQALLELKKAGVTSERIQQPSAPLSQLLQLLTRYEAALLKHQLFDQADAQRQAVWAVLEQRLPRWLQDTHTIIVEGGADLWGANLDLLRAFSGRGVRVVVRMPADSQRQSAFLWPEASLHALEGREFTLEIVHDNRVGTGPLATLRAAQFTSEVAGKSPAEVVEVVEGQAHARFIADKITHWIRSGVAPQHLCVATSELATLGSAVQELLAGYGITAYIRSRAPLRHTHVGRLLLALLQSADDKLQREDIIELWQAFCPTASADAARLRQYGVRTPKISLLAAFPNELQTFLDRLNALPKQASFEHYLAWLSDVLLTMQPPSTLTLDPFLQQQHKQHERTLAATQEMLDALSKAVRLVKQDSLWTRTEFLYMLDFALRETSLPVPGERLAAVCIARPADLVESHFERVLLAGVKTQFPKPDAILTEALRIEVNRHLGTRLLQMSNMTGRAALPANSYAQWLWLEVLASVQDELVVTYTTSHKEDDEHRSEFVVELLRCLQQQHAQAAPLWQPICVPPKLLTQGELAPWLIQKCLVDAELSTSHWDTLGICRYKFFASALLRLRHKEIPTLGADARDEGDVYHKALYFVYRDLSNIGFGEDLKVTVARAYESFLLHRDKILAEVLIHPLLQEVILANAWEVVLAQIKTDVAAYAKPIALEYKFEDLTIALPSGVCVSARGSIDRVDKDSWGYKVIDYKRSRTKRSPGRHFQLPIYAAVVQRDFNADHIATGFMDLSKNKWQTMEEAGLAETLAARLEPVLAGDISPDPESQESCDKCDYARLCRVGSLF